MIELGHLTAWTGTEKLPTVVLRASGTELAMKRREFIGLIGGGAVWPIAVRAQQSPGKVWRVGYLSPGSSNRTAMMTFDAWKDKLRKLGYVEGQKSDYQLALWGR